MRLAPPLLPLSPCADLVMSLSLSFPICQVCGPLRSGCEGEVMCEMLRWEQPSFCVGTSLRGDRLVEPKRQQLFSRVPGFAGVLVRLSIHHASETQNNSHLNRRNVIFCPVSSGRNIPGLVEQLDRIGSQAFPVTPQLLASAIHADFHVWVTASGRGHGGERVAPNVEAGLTTCTHLPLAVCRQEPGAWGAGKHRGTHVPNDRSGLHCFYRRGEQA